MRGMALGSVAVTVLLGVGSVTEAAVFSYYFDQTSHDLSPGESWDAPIYLRETFEAGDTSSVLDTIGLASAGVVVSREGSLGASSLAADITGNPAFDDPGPPPLSLTTVTPWSDTDHPDATKLGLFAAGDAVKGAKAPGLNVWLVQLGTIHFTAQSQLGTATFTAMADPHATSDNLDGNFETIGPVDAASVSVNVVPEPVAVSTVLVVGMQLGFRRRREDNVPRRK